MSSKGQWLRVYGHKILKSAEKCSLSQRTLFKIIFTHCDRVHTV